jgi:hypothetical protein
MVFWKVEFIGIDIKPTLIYDAEAARQSLTKQRNVEPANRYGLRELAV